MSEWQVTAGCFLLLAGARNLYLSVSSERESVVEDAVASHESFGSWLPCPCWRTSRGLNIGIRVLLVEITDIFANSDCFVAKLTVTNDVFAISVSSVAVLFLPRALAIVVLVCSRETVP